MDPAQAPIRASTQEHLNIEDIKDDIIILGDGSCCLILQTNAVNFDLLSETEQDAIIYAYAALLNSLSFPIQIIIHSQHKDVSAYLKLLKKQVETQKSEKLKQQIIQYQKFIEKTVKENEVLDKKFYVVIPFSLLELGVTSAFKQSTKRGGQLPFSKEYILNKAKTNLFPKRDHIIKQFSQLGLKTVSLNTKQLIELFYSIYNPDAFGQKLGSNEDYTPFLVGLDSKNGSPLQKPNPVTNNTSVTKATPVPSVPLTPTITPTTPPNKQLEGTQLQTQINNMVNKTVVKNGITR